MKGHMALSVEENHVTVIRSDPPVTEEDFICINICGMKYETLRGTLEKFPTTLLGNRETRASHFVKSKEAFFFDRNRESFEAILYYYQSGGMLVRPFNIPMDLFTREVSFFKLGDAALSKLHQNEGYVPEEDELPKMLWQLKIWKLFEYPDSSFPAKVVASWSLFVIAVSITVFCMETMPTFNVGGEKSRSKQPWFSLELACIIWFTIEYIVRFISCPNKWKFSKSFLNIIDLLAILPYFITMCVDSGDTTPLSVLRVVRLVRVFRIFKLSRHSLGLQILGHTLRASLSELGMLIFFLFLGVILFSSAMYYAEQGSNSEMFSSIPDAFWYSLVTMTTVGYGDKVPKTLVGKIIGTLCAVSGVLTIALPVPVIVSNFEFYNKRDRVNRARDDKTMDVDSQCVTRSADISNELLNGGTYSVMQDT